MADYYASSAGTAGGDGSIGDPWDLATALAATGSISAGDTLYLRGGTYSGRFTSSLAGASGNTVTIAAYQDERPVIDMTGGGTTGGSGGSGITIEGGYTDWWRIWVTSSNTNRWQAQETTGWWISTGGTNTRLFFCVAHDCGENGFGFWEPAGTGLMHGCASINNGYDDTDRGHGHALYTQNSSPDTKTVERCIFGPCFGGNSIHAYTQAGSIEGFVFRENVNYQRLLVGGDQPVDDATVDENHILAGNLQMGFNAGVSNVDATLTDNVTPDGGFSEIGSWSGLSESGTLDGSSLNTVYVYGSSHDNDRGLVVVYNEDATEPVEIDVSGLSLTVGREYVLAHALNPFAQGYTFTWDGSTNPFVRTDAEWVVASPLGHDAADAGSQVSNPIISAPSGRMAFILAPSAQWPTLTEPAATTPIPDPSTSGTMKTPDEVTGLHSWWKANAIVASDDTPLAAWADSSGNGNDLAQAAATRRPIYKTDILNGYPVVRFVSNDDLYVTFPAGEISQPNTVILVAKRTSGTTIVDGVDSSKRHVIFFPSGAWGLYAGFTVSAGTADSGYWGIWEAVFDGASSHLKVNGEEKVSGNVGTHTWSGIRLGNGVNLGAGGIVGDVAEVVIYDGTVSSADMTALMEYFDAKYFAAATSPSGLPGHHAPWIGIGIGI